jgi:hypothetical protein
VTLSGFCRAQLSQTDEIRRATGSQWPASVLSRSPVLQRKPSLSSAESLTGSALFHPIVFFLFQRTPTFSQIDDQQCNRDTQEPRACPMVWECSREGRTYRSYEIGIAKAFFVGYAFVACRRLYAGRRRKLLLASSAFMSVWHRTYLSARLKWLSRHGGRKNAANRAHRYSSGGNDVSIENCGVVVLPRFHQCVSRFVDRKLDSPERRALSSRRCSSLLVSSPSGSSSSLL